MHFILFYSNQWDFLFFIKQKCLITRFVFLIKKLLSINQNKYLFFFIVEFAFFLLNFFDGFRFCFSFFLINVVFVFILIGKICYFDLIIQFYTKLNSMFFCFWIFVLVVCSCNKLKYSHRCVLETKL